MTLWQGSWRYSIQTVFSSIVARVGELNPKDLYSKALHTEAYYLAKFQNSMNVFE